MLTFSFGAARVHGTPDRTSIDSVALYVEDRGGSRPTSARWGGLARVDEPERGVVSITFDDG